MKIANKKNKTKKARPVKTPKNPEVKYRRELDKLVNSLRNQTAIAIIPILKGYESEYVNDAYARTLEQAFTNLRMAYSNIGNEAKIVANSFVSNANSVNKRKFYSAMEQAVGIDLQQVIQNEDLEDILVATTSENVNLIRSIPEEYFKKIEQAVYTGTTQGSKAGSLIKQIKDIGNVTTKRARLIARDQSSKLNSALSQQRQQNLGIEEYVWRTSQDDRVRESHKSKNGKIFRWDDPPKDTGHPGSDIQCRCVAQPIIKL